MQISLKDGDRSNIALIKQNARPPASYTPSTRVSGVTVSWKEILLFLENEPMISGTGRTIFQEMALTS